MTVMSVLVRTLRKDIARYNRLDSINLDDLNGTSVVEDGVQEDSGWKLVHGDVFRTPSHPLLLSLQLRHLSRTTSTVPISNGVIDRYPEHLGNLPPSQPSVMNIGKCLSGPDCRDALSA